MLFSFVFVYIFEYVFILFKTLNSAVSFNFIERYFNPLICVQGFAICFSFVENKSSIAEAVKHLDAKVVLALCSMHVAVLIK